MQPFPLTIAAGAVAIVLSAAAIAEQSATGTAPPARELLRTLASINDREWTAIEAGQAIAKVLATDSREIAVVGAVRIASSRRRLFERYRNVDSLKRSALVVDAGRFGATPDASDLQSLEFEEHNLDLRDCRPGDCRVRLGASEIERFHRDVNWSDAAWRRQSASVWRDVLARYAAAYRRDGRTALPVYANKRESLSVASELTGLLDSYAFVRGYSASFYEYLSDWGPSGPSRLEHSLYWSKEDFGVRPVTRISHQVIDAGAESSVGLVATNQVYADHYLDAALTVTLAIDDPAPGDRKGFHLIAVTHARTRSLSGLLRSMVRSTVQNRCRDGLRKILAATRTALESSGAPRAQRASVEDARLPTPNDTPW